LQVILRFLGGSACGLAGCRHRSPQSTGGGNFMIVVEQIRLPIGMSGAWHNFAA
jgi:hypothetical protein